MWRRRRGHSLDDDVFREFLRAITTLYPPMEEDVPSFSFRIHGKEKRNTYRCGQRTVRLAGCRDQSSADNAVFARRRS
ncbi:hypothetical protein TNCV_4172321 [Trichonephila clavipes]|nr:hypothetical protein TNCV_4172321 [Trichonephila clavipes]